MSIGEYPFDDDSKNTNDQEVEEFDENEYDEYELWEHEQEEKEAQKREEKITKIKYAGGFMAIALVFLRSTMPNLWAEKSFFFGVAVVLLMALSAFCVFVVGYAIVAAADSINKNKKGTAKYLYVFVIGSIFGAYALWRFF